MSKFLEKMKQIKAEELKPLSNTIFAWIPNKQYSLVLQKISVNAIQIKVYKTTRGWFFKSVKQTLDSVYQFHRLFDEEIFKILDEKISEAEKIQEIKLNIQTNNQLEQLSEHL